MAVTVASVQLRDTRTMPLRSTPMTIPNTDHPFKRLARFRGLLAPRGGTTGSTPCQLSNPLPQEKDLLQRLRDAGL